MKNDSLSDWEQVHAIYDWVRDKVEYKFDKKIRSCLEALDAGHGDCEEMSSLFTSLVKHMFGNTNEARVHVETIGTGDRTEYKHFFLRFSCYHSTLVDSLTHQALRKLYYYGK